MAEGTSRATQDEARQLFGDSLLFRGLSPDERKVLLARTRVRKFASGGTVFLMGSLGDSIMGVLSGNVRISVPSPEGKEIVLGIIHPGEMFGEIALLDGNGRTADAKAMSACSLAVLDRRDVLAFFERHPSAWPGFFEILCKRLRHSTEQLAEVALLDLPARLAKTLLRISTVGQGDRPARSTQQFHLSQRELGNIVGATRESVNKCLREWQRDGIIKIESNIITIKKGSALQKLAENDCFS
jgi:CRP-like cAMP-binding protein